MQLTEQQHKRFWKTMQERYGTRWTENYGEIPTKAWRELLDGFTPKQIGDAIKRLAAEAPLHPPTQPQFAQLLGKTQRAYDDAQGGIDWSRGFWRSCLVTHLADGLVFGGVIKHHHETERYLVQHQPSLGAGLRNLLDELCDMERANRGERTPGLYTKCATTVRQIVGLHLAPRGAA